MAYERQFYPGATSVAENRRKHMSGKLEKLREISDEDLTAILGHRAPGSDYPSTHPPLAEMGEPACSIRENVEPTPGAKAGDRVRYVQFTDSMYNAPATPYFRSYFAAINFRGVDPGTLSGRQIVEARERDMEQCAKVQMEKTRRWHHYNGQGPGCNPTRQESRPRKANVQRGSRKEDHNLPCGQCTFQGRCRSH